MTPPRVTGVRLTLTVDVAVGPGAETLADLLAEIAEGTHGRLTRGEWGPNPKHPGQDVWVRRRTVVKDGIRR